MKKFIPVLFLCLVSCDNYSHKNKYPLYDLEDITGINPQLELPLDSLVSQMNVIPLETNDSCLIDKIDLLKESEDYLFVYTEKNGILYRFNKNGKYLGRISNRGQGPDEFIGIKQIELDNNNQEIYAMDYMGRKMKIYSFDGHFLRSYPLPNELAYSRFTLNTPQKEIYYTSSQNSIQPDLLKYDIENDLFVQLSRHEREMKEGEFFLGQTYFIKLDSSLYIYHYYNDTVYQIKGDKLYPDHLLALGERTIPWTDFSENAIINPKPQIKKIQINKMGVLKDYICIFYSITRYEGVVRKNFMGIYKPKKNIFFPHVNLTSNKFFPIMEGAMFYNGFQEKSILQPAIPSNLDNSILQKYNIQEGDNPVIIHYMLK